MSLNLTAPIPGITGVGSGRARINRQNKHAAQYGISKESQRARMVLKVRRDIAFDKTRLRARVRWVKRANGTYQKFVRFSGG